MQFLSLFISSGAHHLTCKKSDLHLMCFAANNIQLMQNIVTTICVKHDKSLKRALERVI